MNGNKQKITKKNGFVRLLEIAGQKKIHLIVSGVFAVLSTLCALIPYIIMYLVITKLLDPSFGRENYSYIVKLSFAAVAGVLCRYLLFFISTMFSHIAAFNILHGMRTTLIRHLGVLHMGYFNTKRSGEIKKILSEDVEEIEQFIAHHIPDFIAGIALPVITIIYLFTVDWCMTLVALIPLPLAMILQYLAFGSSQRGRIMQNYHDALEAMNGTVVEYVRGMPVVKIFNQTVVSFTRLKQYVYAYRDYISRITDKMAPPWAIFIVITSSSLLPVLIFGIIFYLKGTLPLATFILFLMLGSGYMTPLLRVSMMGGTMSRIMEGVTRIDRILSERQIETVASSTVPENFSIEFDNVCFGYGDKKVLQNTSFSIDTGTVTALVGPSGAGKSTIAQLLLRMWDIDEGVIRMGGVNIKDIPYRELMDLIGFVFQDTFIFSDTVYENIRMGMVNVTQAQIIKATKAAQCYEFIQNLPDGFNTTIGEGGSVHLSGGEKQRISMARIILKNTPVIILDEATAYADAENESKLQAAFSEIMKGRTVIVIAHRLSTITDADQIFVINDGKVAEKGSHAILLKNDTLYRTMWKAHTDASHWTFGLAGGDVC